MTTTIDRPHTANEDIHSRHSAATGTGTGTEQGTFFGVFKNKGRGRASRHTATTTGRVGGDRRATTHYDRRIMEREEGRPGSA